MRTVCHFSLWNQFWMIYKIKNCKFHKNWRQSLNKESSNANIIFSPVLKQELQVTTLKFFNGHHNLQRFVPPGSILVVINNGMVFGNRRCTTTRNYTTLRMRIKKHNYPSTFNIRVKGGCNGVMKLKCWRIFKLTRGARYCGQKEGGVCGDFIFSD